TVYAGQGEPWQCAPLEGHPAYDEELGTQYTEYDVDLANQYLDRAGYTERNSEGIRLRPDGGPVNIVVLVNSAMPDHVDALELIKQDWRRVGVLPKARTTITCRRTRVVRHGTAAPGRTGTPAMARTVRSRHPR